MSYQFVTNNPRLIDKEGAIPVDGTFRDVLVKVRDMVHAGYELISHPLFASSRMMFSPYRTILMGGKLELTVDGDLFKAEVFLPLAEDAEN